MERARRTHVEEFRNFYDGELTMGPRPAPKSPTTAQHLTA